MWLDVGDVGMGGLRGRGRKEDIKGLEWRIWGDVWGDLKEYL